MNADFDHCRELVRELDRDRYLATLLASPEARDAIFALYAFNVEVARVRDMVREPLPGEMRLQWWRDALAGEARGDAASHPVAGALLGAIERYRLPAKPFLDLVDARVFDLYDDPMPTLTDLEGYAGETSSALIQLAAMILADGRDPGTAEAAGHAGVAYALTGLLRALPWHARRGQQYLPGDLMQATGVDRDDYLAGRTTPALRLCLEELRATVRRHLASAREALSDVEPAARPAFLPVAVVEPYLAAMDHPRYDPFATKIELSQLRRQWAIWRAGQRGI